MWYLDAIKSAQDIIYTGITTNLRKRLSEHNLKKSYFTKCGSDWKLIYSEECEDSIEVRKREKLFKDLIKYNV